MMDKIRGTVGLWFLMRGIKMIGFDVVGIHCDAAGMLDAASMAHSERVHFDHAKESIEMYAGIFS